MTDKEIIQALRCMATRDERRDCEIAKRSQLGCAECISSYIRGAADAIERLTAENAALREKVPQWISVDDRHPKPGTRVLATDGVFVGEAYRTSADTWRRYDGIAMRDCIGSVVTHWMPLPAPEEGDTWSYDISFKVKVEGVDAYVPVGACDANITWNVRKIIEKSTGLEWKNFQNNGLCVDVIPKIEAGLRKLEQNPDKFKEYEAPNGWGTVTGTAQFFRNILNDWNDFQQWYEELVPVATFWIE